MNADTKIEPQGTDGSSTDAPGAEDIKEIARALAEAGIDVPELSRMEPQASGAGPEAVIEDAPSAPVEPTAPDRSDEVRFGWAYPEQVSADELIIDSQGEGYLYPSDFVSGTNSYAPSDPYDPGGSYEPVE